MNNDLFLELLRSGLYGKPADCRLFLNCSDNDWLQLYQTAVKQTVLGVVWDGVLTLPTEQQPPREIIYRWLKSVLDIEKTNSRINAVLAEVLKSADELGVKVVLLKGQGTARYYKLPSHRQVGDIDLFSGSAYQVIQDNWSNSYYISLKHEDKKHSAWIYKGVVIENHYLPTFYFHKPYRTYFNRITEEWFTKSIPSCVIDNHNVPIPPVWYEAVYGISHFYSHLLSGGIGLRQLCDWAMIINSGLSLEDRQRISEAIKSLGLKKVAASMAYICVHYLGVPSGDVSFLINEQKSLEKISNVILNDIFRGGNFGNYEYSYSCNYFVNILILLFLRMRRKIRYISMNRKEGILRSFYHFTLFFTREA